MSFKFQHMGKLSGAILIEPRVFEDERGWFAEEYKRSEFERHGIGPEFQQDNQSYSRARGTLRGLHFQKSPAAQGKLVQCLAGEVFDVVVDIQRGSPSYGKWEAVSLSLQHRRLLWVPPGFAHGFQALTDNVIIGYKVTSEYSSLYDRCIRWNDPQLGIAWPHPHPILSKKDAEAPLLSEVDNNLIYSAETTYSN